MKHSPTNTVMSIVVTRFLRFITTSLVEKSIFRYTGSLPMIAQGGERICITSAPVPGLLPDQLAHSDGWVSSRWSRIACASCRTSRLGSVVMSFTAIVSTLFRSLATMFGAWARAVRAM